MRATLTMRIKSIVVYVNMSIFILQFLYYIIKPSKKGLPLNNPTHDIVTDVFKAKKMRFGSHSKYI